MSGRKPPLATGLSPKEGPPGTRVTIRGENLGIEAKDLIGKYKQSSKMIKTQRKYTGTILNRDDQILSNIPVRDITSLDYDVLIFYYRSADMWCRLFVVCRMEISQQNNCPDRPSKGQRRNNSHHCNRRDWQLYCTIQRLLCSNRLVYLIISLNI